MLSNNCNKMSFIKKKAHIPKMETDIYLYFQSYFIIIFDNVRQCF